VTVGPTKLEHTVDPGASVSGQLFLKNDEESSVVFYPAFETFTEDNGEKHFISDDSPILSWINVPASVPLEAGQETKVPYTINVPKDAPPGGHFAVIWWGTTPPVSASSTEQVSVRVRAGILVYINVNGKIIEQTTITQFDTDGSQRWFEGAPVNTVLALANQGNVYVKPTGQVTMASIWGRSVAALPLNQKGLQILPESKRTFGELSFSELNWWLIGPYKVAANVHYGSNNVVDSAFWIWIIPWKALLILAAILLIVFGGGWWGVRRYNHWLLNKFQQQAKPENIA
jgi:hypothetical protein